MDEERVREIVREEFAELIAAQSTKTEIELALMRVNAEHQVEVLANAMGLPDEAKQAMLNYVRNITP